MTKLEAVNRILRAAREHPVSSIVSPTENDSIMAVTILDETSKEIQSNGLHVNQTQTSFTPDVGNDNKVVLPDNTLQVRGWNEHACREFFHRCVDGVQLLFDAKPQPLAAATTNFDDDTTVYVRITQLLEFEELPQPIQFWIADQAAVEYQMYVMGSSMMDKHLRERALRSRIEGKKYDMRSRPVNLITHGRSMGPRSGINFVQRSWPYNDMRGQS
jgi:hypothetical protein